MASKIRTLDDLFQQVPREVYDAERTVFEALPKLVRTTRADRVKALFERHVGECGRQVARLEDNLRLIGQPAEPRLRQPCPAPRSAAAQQRPARTRAASAKRPAKPFPKIAPVVAAS